VADEVAIEAAAAGVGRAEGALAIARATVVRELRAVLTPEQGDELATMVDDLRAVAGNLIERLRAHLDLVLAG
jgi:Spy/CpxP family protein refolding chaperone